VSSGGKKLEWASLSAKSSASDTKLEGEKRSFLWQKMGEERVEKSGRGEANITKKKGGRWEKK